MISRSMELYFLRHGSAVEPEDWGGGEDAGRPLTNAGRLQVEVVGQAMAKLGLGIGAILTSPLVRAKQTAEIVARQLHAIDQLTKEPLLSPGFGPHQLSEILRARGSDRPLLLVGHEPDFGDTIGQLIGGARIVVKKAGYARVDLSSMQPLAGELVWLFPPEAFEPQP
jgi:phosphohistidine phosphatase